MSDLIFETNQFRIERHPQPFISREEGGHIRIFPKRSNVASINDLTISEAHELIEVEIVTRKALIEAMSLRGVPIIWVNIEDLGNWAFKRLETPKLHIHVFGRVATAVFQKWPEAPYLPDRSSGFYDDFKSLNDEDVAMIRHHIEISWPLI